MRKTKRETSGPEFVTVYKVNKKRLKPEVADAYKERLIQLSKLQHFGNTGTLEVISDILLRAYQAGEIPLVGERSFLENLHRLFSEDYHDLFGRAVWEALKSEPSNRKGAGKPPDPAGIKRLAHTLLKVLKRSPSGKPILGFSEKVVIVKTDEASQEIIYPGKTMLEKKALVEDYLKKVYPRYLGSIEELLRPHRNRADRKKNKSKSVTEKIR